MGDFSFAYVFLHVSDIFIVNILTHLFLTKFSDVLLIYIAVANIFVKSYIWWPCIM